MPQHGHMAGLCSTFGTKIWDFSGVGSDFHYSYYTIMEFATKKKKEKRFSINAKIPGCSTVSRGGTEYVCAFLAILAYKSHARYSERVRVQGAMLWHSMSQLCAHYVLQ